MASPTVGRGARHDAIGIVEFWPFWCLLQHHGSFLVFIKAEESPPPAPSRPAYGTATAGQRSLQSGAWHGRRPLLFPLRGRITNDQAVPILPGKHASAVQHLGLDLCVVPAVSKIDRRFG